MKEKKISIKGKVILGVALVFLLGVVAVFSLQIQTVSITGNQYYSEEEIEEMLFSGFWERNPLSIWMQQRIGNKKTIPFIEKYTISLTGPTSAEVIVYEKSMIGYVEFMGSYLYFDKDGMVVESAKEQYGDIPWITGLSFDYAVLHEVIPVKDAVVFQEILQIYQFISTQSIDTWGDEENKPLSELVDRINFDSSGNVSCYIGDVVVALGNSNSLEGKLREMKDILPNLYGQAGTLYLDIYDENLTDQTYIFK